MSPNLRIGGNLEDLIEPLKEFRKNFLKMQLTYKILTGTPKSWDAYLSFEFKISFWMSSKLTCIKQELVT